MAESPISNEGAAPRGSLARRVRLPRLSGKASAAWLVVCFVLTAVLIPMALRLPQWIEYEIVGAVWWAIWLAVLSRLLYTGERVADDHDLRAPRIWFASNETKKSEEKKESGSIWWDGFFWGTIGGEGTLILLGLILLVGLIWLLFEIAIPLLLFLMYVVTRGMLARVVNDRHHCRGRLSRALTWGFVWATVYTAPLAAVVWFVHFVHQRSQAGM